VTGPTTAPPPLRSATGPPEARGLARDQVALLVAETDRPLRHLRFRDLPAALRPGDLVVLNTSDTEPAAVDGHRGDGRPVTVHVCGPARYGRGWVVELRTADGERVLDARAGERVALPGGAAIALRAAHPDPAVAHGSRLWRAAFTGAPGAPEPARLPAHLRRAGRPIRYPYLAGQWPLPTYRTVHAEPDGGFGSAEMPSAGRPVSRAVLDRLRARGVGVARLVLHTGVSSLEAGEVPLPERFAVPAATALAVARARAAGGRVVAVGTTAARALETVAGPDGAVRPGAGWTELVLGPDRPARHRLARAGGLAPAAAGGRGRAGAGGPRLRRGRRAGLPVARVRRLLPAASRAAGRSSRAVTAGPAAVGLRPAAADPANGRPAAPAGAARPCPTAIPAHRVLARRHDPITCAANRRSPIPRGSPGPPTGCACDRIAPPRWKDRFVAGHRSPRGRRAQGTAGSIPATQLTARASGPKGPTVRTSVLASAAAVGAVATGTFSALVPALAQGADPVVDGAGVTATLAASSSALAAEAGTEAAAGILGALQPVTYGVSSEGFAAADDHLARLGKGADLAQQLAEQLAREQAERAEQARLDALIAEGGVDGWVAEALDVLDLPQDLAPGVKNVIMKESGGNPRAINDWDSNARAGTPSQGLMQTIPSTFRHYVDPSLADRPITDPVANITAGVNYMIDRYGVDTLEAGGRTDSAGNYTGY
jgi:S-adenosylmethionine:tRNA ribosyltransferase-isomerase